MRSICKRHWAPTCAQRSRENQKEVHRQDAKMSGSRNRQRHRWWGPRNAVFSLLGVLAPWRFLFPFHGRRAAAVHIRSVKVSSAVEPSEGSGDVFFGAALPAMAVRDDEIVEIPPENRVDAPPCRHLVPNAEPDIQRHAAVLAQEARHVLDAGPDPGLAGGIMLLDDIRDDERARGFVQKRDLVQNGMAFDHANIDVAAPRGVDVVRQRRIDGDIRMTLAEPWRGILIRYM